MSFIYEYPRPAVTVDAVVLGIDDDDVSVLLVERGKDPQKGKLALPGGFLEIDETAREGVLRELREETGLDLMAYPAAWMGLGVYDAVDRDPRQRTISLAFLFAVRGRPPVKGADDASDARWLPVRGLPPLAFDHGTILADALGTYVESWADIGDELVLAERRFTAGGGDVPKGTR